MKLSEDEKTLIKVGPDSLSENGVCEVPSTVTTIGDKAFDSCSGLTEITLPPTITQIGDWTFQGCTGLTQITLPQALTQIGGGAFDGCTALRFIAIDTEDDDEFNRIVALLPDHLRDRALPAQQMKEIRQINKSALDRLLCTHETSKLYLAEQLGDIPSLPSDIRAMISSYHPEDNPYYQQAYNAITKLPLPRNNEAIALYKTKVNQLADQAINSAKQAHQDMLNKAQQTQHSYFNTIWTFFSHALFKQPSQSDGKEAPQNDAAAEDKLRATKARKS